MNRVRHWRIRILVLLDACCFFAIWQLGWWEASRLQEPWAGMAAVSGHAWWVLRETLAHALLAVTLVWSLIGWVWLCCHVRSGRWVYLSALLWYIGTLLVMPPALVTPITGTLIYLNWLLVGILLALCFSAEAASQPAAQEPAP